MKPEFRPAIEALQNDLREAERKVAETKKMINRLCELAGVDPLYADVSVDDHAKVTALRADQFYGKVLTTAAREYLEMRAAQNRGPATPREIYQALLEGGFAFDTKIEANAITNIRATLRKNSSTFHRLPNGQYGLLVWYPKARAVREDGDESDAPAPKRQQKGARVARGLKKVKTKEPPAAPSIASFIQEMMADGKDWNTAKLKDAAAASGIQGLEDVNRVAIHAALMGLRNRGLVELVGTGLWRIKNQTTSPAPTSEVVSIKGAA